MSTSNVKRIIYGWHPFTYASDPSYSVMFNCGDMEQVTVTCMGVNCIDSGLDSTYDSPDDLPVWAQERIAMLMACQDGQTINHIGRRVNANCFWLFGGGEEIECK